MNQLAHVGGRRLRAVLPSILVTFGYLTTQSVVHDDNLSLIVDRQAYRHHLAALRAVGLRLCD